MLSPTKTNFFLMFWLAVAINIIIQVVFNPFGAGGSNPISLASALTGRAVAFLLLPFMALIMMRLITYFTKRPIKKETAVLWFFWTIFFVVSTLSYQR
jgi:hypothetical protein